MKPNNFMKEESEQNVNMAERMNSQLNGNESRKLKQSKKEQLIQKQQGTITAGFNEYMITEKDQPDKNKHLELDYKETELKEAFDILDMNKQGYLTKDELFFFIDLLVQDGLVQNVTEEEIDEMVRLCDKEGDQKVRFDEFVKMAQNKNLNPIGQAFQPTKSQIKAK